MGTELKNTKVTAASALRDCAWEQFLGSLKNLQQGTITADVFRKDLQEALNLTLGAQNMLERAIDNQHK